MYCRTLGTEGSGSFLAHTQQSRVNDVPFAPGPAPFKTHGRLPPSFTANTEGTGKFPVG
jgi:hypothetical protein